MKLAKTVGRVLARAVIFFMILEFAMAIHEYGHLREFQKNNIPVEEFSIGIGKAIYQYQGEEYLISFRIFPLAAYVATTDETAELRANLSLWKKTMIAAAGVRNNLAVALAILLFFQILGWKKRYLSSKELAKTILFTPVKMIMLFFTFMLGCLTFGFIDLKGKFLLSTGKIYPPKIIEWLIVWNLILGLLNIAPILPLDGGHIAQDLLPLSMANILVKLTTFLIIWFIFVANLQNFKVLEADLDNEAN